MWWQDQADVRALNKTLPQGVKVVKSLWGGEYKVVNKGDGYEFRAPKPWGGLEKIDYIPKSSEEKYDVASLNIKGVNGGARFVAIDKFNTEKDPEIRAWAEKIFREYGFEGEFVQDRLGNIDIIKTQEDTHLGGMYVYFFAGNSSIYVVTNGSEEFIKEIILSGKW